MGTKQLSTEGVLNLLSNVKHNLESRQVILNLYFNPINIKTHKKFTADNIPNFVAAFRNKISCKLCMNHSYHLCEISCPNNFSFKNFACIDLCEILKLFKK